MAPIEPGASWQGRLAHAPDVALRALDRRLMAPGSAHRLASVRLALAAVLGLRLALRDWSELAHRPDRLFRPLGVIRLIPAMPSGPVLAAIRAVGVAAALVAIAATVAIATTTNSRVNRGHDAGDSPASSALTRLAAISMATAWVALLVLAGLRSSAGKILHNDVLLLLGSLSVVLGPAGARLGDFGRSPRWGWPVTCALAVVGMVYGVTGLQKLSHGGLAWVTGDNLRWVLYWGANSGRAPTSMVSFAVADRPWLFHAVAAAVILIELSAPFLLLSHRAAAWFVVAAAALHGGIWLTLGLDYWAWILTVAAVALPWDRWWLPADVETSAGSP